MDNETRSLSRLYRSSERTGSSCPDGSALARLADGSTWPWQRRRISAHLSECAHCADEYRALLAARDGLRGALDLPPHPAPDGRRAAAWGMRLAPAGIAVAAVVAVVSSLMLATDPESAGAPEQLAGGAQDTIFVSDFDAGTDPAPDAANGNEMLFRSDFGETRNG